MDEGSAGCSLPSVVGAANGEVGIKSLRFCYILYHRIAFYKSLVLLSMYYFGFLKAESSFESFLNLLVFGK